MPPLRRLGPTSRPLERRTSTPLAILRAALFAGGALHLAVLVTLAAVRIPYPFELEWMEGGCVDAVARVLDGRSIYPEPSLEFIPFLYTPLYFWLCAPVTAVLGIGYLPLRLVSFAASLGCMGAIFALVRRETGSAYAGALGGFLFAAMFELTGWWFDVSRADTTFLLVLFGVVYVLRRFGGSRTGLAAAGALLALSFLTKQTALFVSVPLAFWSLLVHGRRALWFLVPFGLLVAASTAALQVATDGWYLYYIIEAPSTHPVWERFSRHFWVEDLAKPLFFALAVGAAYPLLGGTRWIGSALRALAVPALAGAAVFAAGRAGLGLDLEKAGAAAVATAAGTLLVLRRTPLEWTEDERARAFHAFLFVGLLLGGWYVRRRTGSFNNIVIPTYGGVALLFGLGLARLLATFRTQALAQAAVLALALLQLVHLRYDPRDQVPDARRRATYAAFVERLGEIEGEVFVPAHPFLPTLAGKQTRAHRLAIEDCYTERVERELTESIAERRWAAIVLDRPWKKIADLLEEHYVEQGPLLDAPLRPMTGLFARKAPVLWVPRGEGGGS